MLVWASVAALRMPAEKNQAWCSKCPFMAGSMNHLKGRIGSTVDTETLLTRGAMVCNCSSIPFGSAAPRAEMTQSLVLILASASSMLISLCL